MYVVYIPLWLSSVIILIMMILSLATLMAIDSRQKLYCQNLGLFPCKIVYLIVSTKYMLKNLKKTKLAFWLSI